MKTCLSVLAVLCLVLLFVLALSPASTPPAAKPAADSSTPPSVVPGALDPNPSRPAVQPATPEIEVVFVIDTTSSMSSLIQAAKEKVWSIANTMASARPAPRIKMGLVAYRDRGDAYITRRTDLTPDLDAVYKNLMDFAAEGGADTPESVNQALNEAVTSMQWSSNPSCYRVIFLVGDCPPHMDYSDDVKYPVTCAAAAKAGIIVNTIICGTDPNAPAIWSDIALKAEGRTFRVEQSGSAILANTPFDAELATLGSKLDSTRIYYGSSDERDKLDVKHANASAISVGGGVTAKAQRAEFYAGDAGARLFDGTNDLVADAASNKVALGDLKTETLPDVMQKMSPEERKAFLDKNTAARADLQKRISELAAKRQAFIKEQIRTSPYNDKSSLNSQIYQTLHDQAAKKGINYTDGPLN